MEEQSKEERVHHVFEKIYKNYDSMNSIISFQRHKAWRKDVMKRMKVKNKSSALDVCCGTGDWSISLAKAVGKNGSVVGLDFSKNMLSIAEKKKEEKNLKHLKLIHGNAMELPFEDNSFDYVTIGFGLRNVPDYMTVLKEMYRVVKPGGKVVCLETSQPTTIGIKQLYFFYFRFIMPLFGRLFAKS
ncbi:demethylmenaquinone methyltransferase, partial [Oceanobacillus caeni]|nr:demethylmenaquinone methyltransferase [Oceanobacillus caeni]